MKKSILTIVLALLIAVPSMVRADEGMWLLSLIGKNYADMQKAGLKLTPEEIYSINQNCLKDAIVGLGNEGTPFWHFCTGEIISSQGLVSTNHHCGYGKIQEHSTVGHDYLRDGFWAYSKDQELPNPGLTASVLVRMEDVTDRIMEALSDNMSEDDRAKTVETISAKIEKEAVEGTKYAAKVKPMFNGNQYFLFVHIIYKDVRLVGAPPSSMGKFGGDTDNWSWPRHTCDFSMFRIYTAPDGTPAAYAKENVPLKPKHHLPVSIRPVKNGDYAMVLGFPGTTNHYLTSYGLSETMDITNKLRHEIRTVKINILREEMASSQDIRIKYASKYASCSNAWKYSSEQNKALKNLNIMQVKKDIEREYLAWSKDKAPKYAQALTLIEEGYAARRESREAMMYLSEGLLSGPEMPYEALRLGSSIEKAMSIKDPDQRKVALEQIRTAANAFYKDYNRATEERLCAALFEYVFKNISEKYLPEFLVNANQKFKGNFTNYVSNMFGRSIFATAENFNKFIDNPDLKRLRKDDLYLVGTSAYTSYRAAIGEVSKEQVDNLQCGIRNFVDGIMQINKGRKLLSPDANSTIRCTYGNVKAYDPRDAVAYSHYTTLKGVMEKEDPTSSEFFVPARLKELYEARDFGRYADANGDLPTCFITTNDITGGNSGSPVIDAQGNLIGLAFDGNSEAMSGDINFEKDLQRCICLDARYMLFVIDKYAGARNLIEEMDIVQ